MSRSLATLLIFGLAFAFVRGQSERDWFMAGANPQRTSWVSEEVKGNLKPLWFRPFEPYISQKVQVIASYGMLFIATANGLYALDAATGEERWIYPTEMPVGHSPTVVDGVVYFGCFDKKLYAVDAFTGERLWSFAGERGFHTNPLVVHDAVYIGNRDGYLYAVGAQTGQLLWRFKADASILFSAAYSDGVIFFATSGSHAYAVDAEKGELIWKSERLPGSGFHSWWPVVHRDVVIFAGTHNYKKFSSVRVEGMDSLHNHELHDIYPNRHKDPKGTLVGPVGSEPGSWASGTATINVSQPNVTEHGETTAITEYFERKPWRRTYFVLDRSSGQEISYDFDEDGVREYAPILWAGTHSGNRYPPIVGNDDVLYQQNNYFSDPWIAGGHVSGWEIGRPFISIPYPPRELGGGGFYWNAVDEPLAYSGGGNLVYWNRCCDRVAGWFDLTQTGRRGTGWNVLFSYNNGYGMSLTEQLPGYKQYFHNPDTGMMDTSPYASFGRNGVYGWHADSNPPIPYNGRVYLHRSNCVVAFASTKGQPNALPISQIVPALPVGTPIPDVANLRAILESEVQKMLDAGHLRPAYASLGAFDRAQTCGDALNDYWHNSAETVYTLLRTLPHLSAELREPVASYLQAELSDYPPHKYSHVGWRGAPRETYEVPPDVRLAEGSPRSENWLFPLWRLNPFFYYAYWKYAEEFGGATQLFEASRSALPPVPSEAELQESPNAHNTLIAGYLGYLELERLAGYPESTNIRLQLERLLELRVSAFTKDSPYADCGKLVDCQRNCRTLNVANNFMFLVPELANHLRQETLPKVEKALEEYAHLAPFWYVTKAEEGFGENAITPVYDSHAIFHAKALILREPFEVLAQYIDVPVSEVGDLYFIQNLVVTLEAPRTANSAQRLNLPNRPRRN